MPQRLDCPMCGHVIGADEGVTCHLAAHAATWVLGLDGLGQEMPARYHFETCPQCGLECWGEHVEGHSEQEEER